MFGNFLLICGKGGIMVNEKDEILTLDEVAIYLKAGKRTVYRLAAARKIPAFKVGGTWRFSRVDIDLWIKNQSNQGGVPVGSETANSRSNDGECKQ